MEQALQGLKVVDMTRVLAGPYATMLLADMGADVLKIEMPGKGDDSRAYGPYVNGESAYFMSINRNKRSLTLNLKNEDAKEILIKLIKEADVLVENFRPGTMEKLGLGYDVLREINPKLIYAASSGFGHSGPYSKRPAYDGVVQAMGGIMSITGEKDGRPTRVGPSIGDVTAGLFTAIGILGALNYRNETGKGQKVDVAMLDGQVAILENAVARYFATGTSPKPAGNVHTSIFPFQPFETVDGEIMIAAGNDNLFRKLWHVFGDESVADDPRFKTNPLRGENYDEMIALITEETKKKTTQEWQTLLDEAGVPNGPINNIEMVVNDPQIKAREMILEVNHPVAGQTFLPGVPIKMSETQGYIRKAAPVLGEDTEDILMNLGYSENEIQRLREEGAI
ncbi:CoA transferase [Tuanshanicoccus lijuaniae]|uniref:CaiB/BaiF CoA transferase family protein n=1 Tax=Aerococcaceae bacterium zg-1292 TaxID=2774330 RepID=UPI001935819C|nr:CoA transferase [Aerococcaceae bacterium zg-1292]MBS4455704.1 CoA transferase [Aerococcaceae bacterium zg-A91]MBS4457455.1 CoA transferase [Aerococcaceae bacterium zg-BR33]QQA37099.1 CoA transferase [Aerococcaceae bacterium zg-1292]